MRKTAITTAAIALVTLACFGSAHAGEPASKDANQTAVALTEPCVTGPNYVAVEVLVQTHWPAQIPTEREGVLPSFEGVLDAAVGAFDFVGQQK